MLSRLPEEEALDIIDRSELKAYTAHTTCRREDLAAKLRLSAERGFATAFSEVYNGDASIAAAILDEHGRPEGAVNIAVSYARYTEEEAVGRFSPLVVAAARAISRN